MTLGYMQRMAIEGSKDLEVRSAAVTALDRYGAPAHAPEAALGAIYRFIQDRIRFVPDPVGTQMVQSPRATLEFGSGNCAQRATLLAAMARSVGVPADLRFRVAALNPRFPSGFSHVYVVANVGGKQIPLDPTYPGIPPGAEPRGATRVGDFPVYHQLNGCRGPGCYYRLDPKLGFNPLKSLVKVVKKAAMPAALFATKFLPGGVIVSTAAKLAIGTAGSGTGTSVFKGRQRLASLLAERRAASAARAATPAMAPAQPVMAASMAAPAAEREARPVSESQVAQAAASEAAPTQALPGGSMAPLLLLGGLLLLPRLLRKARH
jgi:transglutaminase superfamily protein